MTSETSGAPGSRKRAFLFAGGLLGAVLVTIVLVSGLLRPPEPPTRPEYTSTTTAGSWFGDLDHGFVLAKRCTSISECTQNVFVTEDGKTWVGRSSPVPVNLASVVPLGGCRLVVERWGTDGIPPARWFSADCARSWQRVPVAARGSTEQIPPGGHLDFACNLPGAIRTGCGGRLVVTLPSNGHRVRLDVSPALDGPMWVQALPSGVWAVSGSDPASGDPAVAVSADRGRSWKTGVLPGGRDQAAGSASITARGQHVYAWADVTTEDTVTLGAIWHSANGGVTWERTWRQRTPDPAVEGFVTLVPRESDLLVIHNNVVGEPIHRVSTDHGRTLAPVQLPAPLRSVRFVPGGMIGIADQWGPPSFKESQSFYRSHDGVRWEEIATPPTCDEVGHPC